MSTQIRFIGLPRHIAVSAKEVTEQDGQRVTLVVFGSEPDDASQRIREYEALAERVVTAMAPTTRPPEPGLTKTQLRQVREEVRLWWRTELKRLFPAPPLTCERKEFVREYFNRSWLLDSEDELRAASDEIAALEALRRLRLLLEAVDPANPPASSGPSGR